MSRITRRRFVSRSIEGAVALGAASYFAPQSRAAANGTLGIALIGTGGRYRSYLPELAKRSDVRVLSVCDVDEGRAADAAGAVESSLGHKPAVAGDYRRVLDDPAVDVVFVATTHHWHGPVAVPALLAGKDVYVEKPASHVFREGRSIVEAARRTKTIVQHGTQMRSSEVTAAAAEVLTSGIIGEVKTAKAWNVQRRGTPTPVDDEPAPAGVDYDMWLGPAPTRPFNRNRFHGHWNAYRDYGNGDIGNDGAHDLDMARFGLGVTTHPVKITAHASTVDLGGEREFPDNMLVAYQYEDGKVLIYEDRMWTPYRMNGFDSGNAFYGTQGYMIFSRRGYFQVFLGDNDEKGPGMQGGAGMDRHVANFLDCVHERKQPLASAEITHLSCGLIHLGEIAGRLQRILRFDPTTEQFPYDPEATRMLTKDYRSPYTIPEV
jgi:predicted dehydrogenase